MKTRILHLYCQPNRYSDQMARSLAERALAVDDAPDCYAALAWIVQRGAEAYAAGIVDLSALSPTDREFFQLVSRRFRALPLWVYGRSAGDLSADWAQAGGALGRIEVEELDLLLERPVAATRRGPIPPPAELQTTDRRQEPPALQPSRAAAADAPEGEFHIRSPQKARQQPKRRPPKAPAERPVKLQDNSGSLLTREELDALLGEEPGGDEMQNEGQA